MFVLVVIPGNRPGQRIGAVKVGESGYYPTTLDFAGQTEASAEQLVREMNSARGISPEVADSALAGSMFGWKCPAAKLAVATLTSSTIVH